MLLIQQPLWCSRACSCLKHRRIRFPLRMDICICTVGCYHKYLIAIVTNSREYLRLPTEEQRGAGACIGANGKFFNPTWRKRPSSEVLHAET